MNNIVADRRDHNHEDDDNDVNPTRGTPVDVEAEESDPMEMYGIEIRDKGGNEIIDLNEIPGDLQCWNFTATIIHLGQAGALLYM